MVKVDGCNGFAPLALEVGREPLIERARELGIAALAVTNTHHFAALWPETEALAERGLVGFAYVAAMSYVAPGRRHEAALRHQPDVVRVASGRAAARRSSSTRRRARAPAARS